MQIRRVTVSNFRGIREAEWRLPAERFLCLVGPGDSTKTTLLDAIALVLTSRFNVTFSDADFYQCDTSRPITLRVLIGDLSDDLLADTAFGMNLTGLTANGDLEHDPLAGSEPCVLLQLSVDQDLEPTWSVVRHGEYEDGLPLTGGRRKSLGLFRVDERVDTHLRWGRGSALTRITNDGASEAVTVAQRASRNAVFDQPLPALEAAAKQVSEAAGAIGGGRFDLRPGWDPVASASPSALLLHEGNVPLTNAGLGSRRLTSIAAQEQAAIKGDILLIDEIEHGLDPHRLLHVLHQIKQRSAGGRGQVIISTHSPLAVQAMNATDICVVQNDAGKTEVRAVPADIAGTQGALRACPSAILARKVVVGEGKTEAGIIRHLIRAWNDERARDGKPSHAALGVAFLDGGGNPAAARATIFQNLGIQAVLVVDRDDPSVDGPIALAEKAGVEVIRWQPGKSTESEVIHPLDEPSIVALLELAVDLKGSDAVVDHVTTALPRLLKNEVSLTSVAWSDAGYTLEEVRAGVAKAAGGGAGKKASDKAWFKREDAGERLGEFILQRWFNYQDQHLGEELTKLRRHVYGDEEQQSSDE
ncbi:DNA replication and repair protein RecF [Micromonospora sp. MH33]|uniref:ATP-dependent nuclease n=1 Tax=Micromonospora sp. MH33 TaxID=1945509 RepID=UPI000D27DEF8|nr:ATP-binding protein [Micromonospora sp. MH33]PSK64832.1 DNA replication and repair protein RecF [Micromonospora sp. MH33]